MLELVKNGAVVRTGTEQEVRAAGADEITPLADLDPTYATIQRAVITRAAEAFRTGPFRRFDNGLADLKLEVRSTDYPWRGSQFEVIDLFCGPDSRSLCALGDALTVDLTPVALPADAE